MTQNTVGDRKEEYRNRQTARRRDTDKNMTNRSWYDSEIPEIVKARIALDSCL